ncbi:MAG: D-glycero-beta-D-manno-heptose 1,7-bisphosphate 7-phosphatase [Legionella sp.]
MTKLIILDRDGVINQDSLHYIKMADEFILLPGSAQAIARLVSAGYRVAVATNQSGVSRGLYSEQDLAAIHQKMHASIKEAGGYIDWIEYCIHLPEAGCFCRKPNPGMLLAIAEHYNCSLMEVPFIGDRLSDIQAAYAAGAKPSIVLSPMTDRLKLVNYPDVAVYQSLAEWVDCFLP